MSGEPSGTARRQVKVADAAEIDEGKSKTVVVEGRTVALFKVNNEYFAINNPCLHRGGPLGEGELDGFEVICPWHGWRYNLRTGSLSLIPTLKEKVYPVKLVGTSIFVEV
ncbi:MAG: Rieske 2Fe-2S domain-containing protein [Thaumarchaeota archaeon]|nr:Rieske 2Fe-2S domain-containing protein [Nitrososphaerota archaeon]